MKLLVLTISLFLLFESNLGLAQDTQNPPSKSPRTSFKIQGHKAFVILPPQKHIQSGRPIPWVFYAPTFEGILPSDRDEGWMIQRWLDKGIAIAGVDIGESYGSPAGRAIYNALHKQLVRHYGFDPKASLLARSRGGLMLYCWAVENPEKIRCIAGIYPVCDLRSYPGVKQAHSAYELTEEELAQTLEQHNPIPRLLSLAQADVPIFHIHGDKDKIVPLDANSGALKKAYQELGGSMELEIAPGQWHNMWRGFFECQALVDFVIAHVGR